jgi:hypothetical protein
VLVDITPVSIAEEIRDARQDFRRLVDEATTAELRRSSNGTRWTNDQLLFHMLFGYLVVRSLLWLVRGFSMLPEQYSRRFARVLDATTRPFHLINYLGSVGGARVLGHGGMERVMDIVTDSSSALSPCRAKGNWHGGCISPWAGIHISVTT